MKCVGQKGGEAARLNTNVAEQIHNMYRHLEYLDNDELYSGVCYMATVSTWVST